MFIVSDVSETMSTEATVLLPGCTTASPIEQMSNETKLSEQNTNTSGKRYVAYAKSSDTRLLSVIYHYQQTIANIIAAVRICLNLYVLLYCFILENYQMMKNGHHKRTRSDATSVTAN